MNAAITQNDMETEVEEQNELMVIEDLPSLPKMYESKIDKCLEVISALQEGLDYVDESMMLLYTSMVFHAPIGGVVDRCTQIKNKINTRKDHIYCICDGYAKYLKELST